MRTRDTTRSALFEPTVNQFNVGWENRERSGGSLLHNRFNSYQLEDYECLERYKWDEKRAYKFLGRKMPILLLLTRWKGGGITEVNYYTIINSPHFRNKFKFDPLTQTQI